VVELYALLLLLLPAAPTEGAFEEWGHLQVADSFEEWEHLPTDDACGE